jgi:uncharacterized DUF497 family protein
LRAHGVTFDMARGVFDDAFGIEWADSGQAAAEERYVTVGMVDDRLLAVAYTNRGERIRINSARLAEPYERPRYHNENST